MRDFLAYRDLVEDELTRPDQDEIPDLLTAAKGTVMADGWQVGQILGKGSTARALLMTSDGELAARLTHPSHEVERVYEAIVVGAPGEEALDKLRRGVFLDGRRTARATVRRGGTTGKGSKKLTKLTLGLHEGRNRQVRRMCASIGHPVRRLTRVRMGPIALGNLRAGQWRDLTSKEVELLRAAEGKGKDRHEDSKSAKTTRS